MVINIELGADSGIGQQAGPAGCQRSQRDRETLGPSRTGTGAHLPRPAGLRHHRRGSRRRSRHPLRHDPQTQEALENPSQESHQIKK